MGLTPLEIGLKLYFCVAMKKYKQLTPEQRYKIEAFKKAGWSISKIAEDIGVNISTISRELRRNKPVKGYYKASYAQSYAEHRKSRLRQPRRLTDSILSFVNNCITKEQFSPEQIVGYARKLNIPMVCHETIYKYIREDKIKGGDLYRHLRHKLKHRKRPVGGKHINIKDKVSIEQRPEIINNRSRFGDWEIDTIIGKNNRGAILTIVERKTKMLIMKKLTEGKNAKALSIVVKNELIAYADSIRSITSDNGSEFAEHKKIANDLNIDFYFAHPYSSWERGLNENTNGLIRQYIPKGTDFNEISDEQIKEIQYKLNRRPRKLLDYETPVQRFFANS